MLHFWRDRFLRVQFLKGIFPCLESRPSTSDSLHFQVPKRFFAFVRPGRQSYASRHELWRSWIVHHGQDWDDASIHDATPNVSKHTNVTNVACFALYVTCHWISCLFESSHAYLWWHVVPLHLFSRHKPQMPRSLEPDPEFSRNSTEAIL